MARRSKGKDRGSDDSAARSTGGQSGGLMAPASVHSSVTMGLSNLSRDFNVTDGVTNPSFVIRYVRPYAAFYEGWDRVDRASQLLYDFTGDTYDDTTQFVPITDYAQIWDLEMGPVLNRIYTAALTSYTVPRIDVTARYFSNLIKAYGILYSIAVLNYVTYHMDWKQIFPYTGKVPKALYDICAQFGADDISIAQDWMPYMRILEQHTLFPWIVNETKRMLTPMLSNDMNGRIFIPLNVHTVSDTKANLLNTVAMAETVYELYCADARRTAHAYLPYPMSQQAIWHVHDPVADPLRMSGWFNSQNEDIDTYGDTGDPVPRVDAQVCYDSDISGEEDRFRTYSITPQPTWEEIKLGSVWALDYFIADNEFHLLTPHNYKDIIFHDEYSQYTSFSGDVTATTDSRFELMQFAHNRWVMNSSDADDGLTIPGYLLSTRIDRAAIKTMLTMEVLDNFHYDELVAINSLSMGHNTRIRRREVANLV